MKHGEHSKKKNAQTAYASQHEGRDDHSIDGNGSRHLPKLVKRICPDSEITKQVACKQDEDNCHHYGCHW
ncbi:hypothetical protein HPB48_011825 [Haemaphysalis longicornis]|uniref:Uncharacterized protein n=1 Tax=Haemaphysalis longicornis TaxID=44386 RepID=A0A9J6FZT2_HAELO|nr:hypothetical protein HPB48_011825 [Haemaphysalis longicornis]